MIGNPNFQPTRSTSTLKLENLAVGTHVFTVRVPEALMTLAVTSASGTANIEYTYDPERPLFDGVAAPNADWAAGIIAREWETGATADGQETIEGPVTAIKVTVATAPATVVVAPTRKKVKKRRIAAIRGPETISDLRVWWDVSEVDGNFVFSDLLRTIPITNGGLVRGVLDRSGNGIHATIWADGNRGTWLETGQNGIGSLDCDAAGGGVPKSIETGAIGTLSQPYTMVGCGKVAALNASERHALFSMTTSVGSEMRILRTVDSGENQITTIGGASTGDGHNWGGNTGEWWMFLMEIDGATSGVQYGSNGSPTIQDVAPAFNDHNAGVVVPVSLRFGAGVDGVPNIRSGWDEEIGEMQVYDRLLTGPEKNLLVRYYSLKWNLTATSL